MTGPALAASAVTVISGVAAWAESAIAAAMTSGAANPNGLMTISDPWCFLSDYLQRKWQREPIVKIGLRIL
jgi:hypothetical protein